MKQKKGIQVIVLDFDGTMVESLEPVVHEMNRWVEKAGQEPVTEQSIGKWLPQTDVKQFGFGWLYRRATEVGMKLVELRQSKHIRDIQAVPKLMNVLTALRRQGYRLGIVTTNSRENVENYLELNGWDWLFSFIYADSGLFGKGRVIESLLDEQGIKPNQFIYVGDEPRDVLAAKEAGVKAVAVTWGYQAKEAFFRVKPHWIISKPIQLLEIVGSMPRWRRVIASLIGY